MWSHAVAVSLLSSKIEIKNYQNMGPKLAPRNQVYVPDKPANEAGSPVVIRVSVTRPTIAIQCWADICTAARAWNSAEQTTLQIVQAAVLQSCGGGQTGGNTT